MMGRKPTKNLNLPPRMRARPKSGGVLWYYYDAGGKPRKEIPLGNDYVLAVRKWSALEEDAGKLAVAAATFPALWDRYQRDALPALASTTQKGHRTDIKNLLRFFGNPPAPLDQIKPMHIRQFLDWMRAHPTTANRSKRLFSVMWNHARAIGWTDKENPCIGIKGLPEGKREVYVTDEVYAAIHAAADQPVKDAMDLIYLTGQRPGDALRMSERDIVDGTLPVHQGKTGARLRVRIVGELASLIDRIKARKAGFKVWHAALLVGSYGKPLTTATLRNGFEDARTAAAKACPNLADDIRKTWLYDLRAKAADDKADSSGEDAASKLLGHTQASTTRKHYLRRGRIVEPVK